MHLRNSILATGFYRAVDRWILPEFEKVFPHPSQVSAVGLGFAVLVPLGFYLHPVFGALFLILSGMIDAMDGRLARRLGMASEKGALLDSCFDRISDFFYLYGFWILYRGTGHLFLWTSLIMTALTLIAMISYIKARAESLGIACSSGVLERGWRTLYLIGWALGLTAFPSLREPILWYGLLALIALALVTNMQRWWQIRSRILTPAADPPARDDRGE